MKLEELQAIIPADASVVQFTPDARYILSVHKPDLPMNDSETLQRIAYEADRLCEILRANGVKIITVVTREPLKIYEIKESAESCV
jgi:hypothetical protein